MMRITVKADVNINVNRMVRNVVNDEFGEYAAVSWHRLYHKYVPYDTGTLADTVRIRPWEIEHTVPYAHRMYEGHFNFRKDMHPDASRKWDKAAEPTQKPKLIQEMQRFVDRRL